MFGRAPGCADRHTIFPTARVPLPVCCSALAAVKRCLTGYKSTVARRVGVLSRSCFGRYPGLLRAEDKANNTIFFKLKGERTSLKGAQRRTWI